jgi:hypothetical protein
LDRYDLRDTVGCDVTVGRLLSSARTCDYLGKLMNGVSTTAAVEPISRVVASRVQGCSDMSADDGFVYNVAVHALDRAIAHRRNFVNSLKAQL